MFSGVNMEMQGMQLHWDPSVKGHFSLVKLPTHKAVRSL